MLIRHSECLGIFNTSRRLLYPTKEVNISTVSDANSIVINDTIPSSAVAVFSVSFADTIISMAPGRLSAVIESRTATETMGVC